MKQHITSDQLNELSDKAKNKLWKMAEPHDYEFNEMGANVCNRCGNFQSIPDFPGKCLPLLSIGQMIEFLVDNNSPMIKNDMGTIGSFEWVAGSEELCDDLWEAVKEVLEGEVK